VRSPRVPAWPDRSVGTYLSISIGEVGGAGVIHETWVAGVSTRKVEDLVQAMGMSGISKRQVAKLCKEIDERVNCSWSDRSTAMP